LKFLTFSLIQQSSSVFRGGGKATKFSSVKEVLDADAGQRSLNQVEQERKCHFGAKKENGSFPFG
jgi:hypothetical protein